MSKQAEQDLINQMNEIRAVDPLLDEKMAYWQEAHDAFNTTGLSLMQLNDTPEGKIKATKICEKIGAAMVAKFGEDV
tara:strand:- start:322 stop:552 length:231 start_codon:yes stop_codon:yes gene_type:complete